jgi:hypothetical protein
MTAWVEYEAADWETVVACGTPGLLYQRMPQADYRSACTHPMLVSVPDRRGVEAADGLHQATKAVVWRYPAPTIGNKRRKPRMFCLFEALKR